MAFYHRDRSSAPALVGRREFRGAAERKGWDQFQRESRSMVVIDQDDDIGFGVLDPFLGEFVTCEQWLPVRLRRLTKIDRSADGRHVRRGESCEDARHVYLPASGSFVRLASHSD